MKSIFLAALVMLMAICVPSIAQAQSHRALYPHVPWDDNNRPCYDEAARYHGVDPWLLYAIARVESKHNPAAINRANRNGTYDAGLMQINSIHHAKLRRYGIDPTTALYNACASTYIGAWVLADAQRRYGNTWQAIAAYNVGSLNTEARRKIGWNYANKVYEAYAMLASRHRR